MVEGLAGQVRGSTISLWPVMIQRQINAAYGVTLEFMDGTTCQTRLNDSMTHGVSLTADRDDIVAAEAAVCDDEEGACVPVRLMFRPLETEVAGKIRTAR